MGYVRVEDFLTLLAITTKLAEKIDDLFCFVAYEEEYETTQKEIKALERLAEETKNPF